MTGRPILRPSYGADPSSPVIHLERAGDRFTIRVRPCPDDMPSLQDFSGYIEARTQARHLRFAHGWRLCDDVDNRTRQRAIEAEEARVEAKRNGLANG